MTPFFTVIITTYNRPQKLIRAIKSVIDQTYQDYELVIVNDGSDKDYSQVEEFIDAFTNIKYYYKVNEERSVARNYGVNKSSGQYICFLDDDDYYLDNHLHTLYDEIKKQNFGIALYHTYSKKYNQDGSWSKYEILPKDDNLSEQEYYLSGGIMTMNCSCFHKKILEEFPYDPELKMSEDSNQRLRALSKYPIYRIPIYTSVYDFSESSTKEENINNVLEFIKTWGISFKDPLIKPYINKRIQRAILSNLVLLLLNNHRKDLSMLRYIKWLLIYSFSCRTTKALHESVILLGRKFKKV